MVNSSQKTTLQKADRRISPEYVKNQCSYAKNGEKRKCGFLKKSVLIRFIFIFNFACDLIYGGIGYAYC